MKQKNIIVVLVVCLSLCLIYFTQNAYGGTAYLDITSKPDKVLVQVNNNNVGLTPITGLEVPAGKISIVASKSGYGSASYTIAVKRDELKKVFIALRPTKEQTGETQQTITIRQDKGDLIVINKLGAVPVVIDGRKKGKGSIKIVGIATGNHELQVGPNKRSIKIYKNYLLKVKCDQNGIIILNDKHALDNEKERKREQRLSLIRSLKEYNIITTSVWRWSVVFKGRTVTRYLKFSPNEDYSSYCDLTARISARGSNFNALTGSSVSVFFHPDTRAVTFCAYCEKNRSFCREVGTQSNQLSLEVPFDNIASGFFKYHIYMQNRHRYETWYFVRVK